MAREEITRLSSERPNDPDTAKRNRKQIDLLYILADGFAKIAAALEAYSKDPQPLLAGEAKEIVDWVGAQFRAWWEANAVEARDWCIRLPIITAAIGALGSAGANMTVATTAVTALVGGPKVVAAIKTATKRRKRPWTFAPLPRDVWCVAALSHPEVFSSDQAPEPVGWPPLVNEPICRSWCSI
jgi:hypothetical protein